MCALECVTSSYRAVQDKKIRTWWCVGFRLRKRIRVRASSLAIGGFCLIPHSHFRGHGHHLHCFTSRLRHVPTPPLVFHRQYTTALFEICEDKDGQEVRPTDLS